MIQARRIVIGRFHFQQAPKSQKMWSFLKFRRLCPLSFSLFRVPGAFLPGFFNGPFFAIAIYC